MNTQYKYTLLRIGHFRPILGEVGLRIRPWRGFPVREARQAGEGQDPGRHEVGRQPRAEVQAQVLALRLSADLSRDRSPGSSEAKNNDLEV